MNFCMYRTVIFIVIEKEKDDKLFKIRVNSRSTLNIFCFKLREGMMFIMLR